MAEEDQSSGGEEKAAAPRRKIALESTLYKSVLEIQHNRQTGKERAKEKREGEQAGTGRSGGQPAPAVQGKGQRETEREQREEREKARAAKLRMEETALLKKKDKENGAKPPIKGGKGKEKAQGKAQAKAQSKEAQLLSLQEKEREQVRQKKMAWVEKQGQSDTRKVQHSVESRYAAVSHVTLAGPPEKITVSIGPDSTRSAQRSTRDDTPAGKDKGSWAELTAAEQKAASTLGWSERSFDNGEACDSSDASWAQLNSHQRRAAVALGYDHSSWNSEAGFEDTQVQESGTEGHRGQAQEAAQRARGPERVAPRGTGGSGTATVDEAALEARLEREGALPPHYVRGRESVLLLKIEVGPGKRAALVVRKGDDPGWLAKGFCRRHNVPSQLTTVVQQNIEANLAALAK